LYPAAWGGGVTLAELTLATMLSTRLAVWSKVPELFTRQVKEKVPFAVGVPVITPVLESARPVGNLPDTILHVYGVVPPWAANRAEYFVPTVAAGSVAVVIAKVAAKVVVAIPNKSSRGVRRTKVLLRCMEEIVTASPRSRNREKI
jgi:hypothetical protein